MIKSNITDKRPRREKFKKEIVLISGGFADRKAFPDGKITIYPWDSNIDAWLTSAANKSTGLERERLLFDLMSKVCNLNGCKLDDFVLGDVNAVLMTARTIANASKIQYLTKCPKCGHEEMDEIVVPDELEPIGKKAPDYKGFDTLTLDDSKDMIDVRPLRVRDELAISTRTPEQQHRISDHIAHLIAPVVNVNGTQPDRIEEMLEWFEALSPHDAQQLEDFIEKSTPHFNQELPHQCDRCGNFWKHPLVLDQEFFRSGRMGAANRTIPANVQSLLGREGVQPGADKPAGPNP